MILAEPKEHLETAELPTRVRVVGGGDVAVALAQLARVLHWDCTICERLDDRDDLSSTDAMVVLSHNVEIAGPALGRGLAGSVAYVGGMGSSTTQRRRRDWLLSHRTDPSSIDRIHGPAGLDIGAADPREIALAIMAEITAVRHGAPGGSLHPVQADRPEHLQRYRVRRDCPGVGSSPSSSN